MAEKTFRDRVLDARPDLAEQIAAHPVKRKLALALRALRKEQGMTQAEVGERSGLGQPMISRLEAPAGPLPTWETVMRYVEACGGHMVVGFSAHAVDEAAFVAAGAHGGDGIVSAVAM